VAGVLALGDAGGDGGVPEAGAVEVAGRRITFRLIWLAAPLLVIAAWRLSRRLARLFADRRPHAIKTGAMGSRQNIVEVAYMLEKVEYLGPLIVDPVIASSDGKPLFDDEGVEVKTKLLAEKGVVSGHARR
jgi:hypothetical protein